VKFAANSRTSPIATSLQGRETVQATSEEHAPMPSLPTHPI